MHPRWNDSDNSLFDAVLEDALGRSVVAGAGQGGVNVRLLFIEYNKRAQAAGQAKPKTAKQLEGKLRRRSAGAAGKATNRKPRNRDQRTSRPRHRRGSLDAREQATAPPGAAPVSPPPVSPIFNEDARFVNMEDAEFDELMRLIEDMT